MNAQRMAPRFGVTVLVNAARAVCAFAGGLLLARTLGASQYGDLVFLLGSFTAASQLLDGGSSSAFFTLLAAKRRPAAAIVLYGVWLAAQCAIVLVVVGLLLPESVIARLWLGHQLGIVLTACVSTFLMTQLWTAVSQLGEAVRQTVLVQSAGAVQAVAHLGLLAAGAAQGWLSVSAVLWLLIAEYALLAVCVAPGLIRANMTTSTGAGVRMFWSELLAYCKPLVLYTWLSCIYAFADAWLLQRFGGATQQGFFGVAQQFSAVSVLLATSVLKVFWKEVAEAHDQRNQSQVQRLYLSTARWLYLVAAWLGCLALPYSRELFVLLLNPAPGASWMCLALLLVYPAHQALGQISGAFLYATKQTRTYVKINTVMMLVSLPVTWTLLAWLNLGAAGLALKLVVLQWIGVNWQMAVIAKSSGAMLGWRQQATVLAACAGLGWACKWIGIVVAGQQPWLAMVLGGLCYAGVSLAVLLWLPGLADLRQQLQWLRLAQPPAVSA